MLKTKEQLAIEEQTRALGKTLGSCMRPGTGFMLLVFDFNGGFSTYVSNAQRADMIVALRDLATRLEQEIA